LSLDVRQHCHNDIPRHEVRCDDRSAERIACVYENKDDNVLFWFDRNSEHEENWLLRWHRATSIDAEYIATFCRGK
jgi:hypothetical protein